MPSKDASVGKKNKKGQKISIDLSTLDVEEDLFETAEIKHIITEQPLKKSEEVIADDSSTMQEAEPEVCTTAFILALKMV
jgi:hypothetical protein